MIMCPSCKIGLDRIMLEVPGHQYYTIESLSANREGAMTAVLRVEQFWPEESLPLQWYCDRCAYTWEFNGKYEVRGG